MEKIILASGSPRRKELLSRFFEIQTKVCDADETLPKDLAPKDAVMYLAETKAKFVADTLKDGFLVIGADTVVCIDGKILGKPKDELDAYSILTSLSGKTHSVYTGFCVIRTTDGKTVTDFEETQVTFRNLDDDEIKAYIKTGEPIDKAGAYGIQGLGGAFISGIMGDYYNTVGLPLCKLINCLKKDFNKGVLN